MYSTRISNRMNSDWDDKTTLEFARLVRDKNVGQFYLNKKKNSVNKQYFFDALKDISRLMKSYNLTPAETGKKIAFLKNIYSEEKKKMEKDPSYKPDMIWFPVIEEIFKSKNTGNPKGLRKNSDPSSQGRKPNQPPSNKVEPEDFENQITQLFIPVQRETANEASFIKPQDKPFDIIIKEDTCSPPSEDVVFTSPPHEVTDATQDETPNEPDFPTCENDDIHRCFGNYLITLLGRLPLEKSYELQQKFTSETITALIQFGKEHSLPKNKEVNTTSNQLNRVAPGISSEMRAGREEEVCSEKNTAIRALCVLCKESFESRMEMMKHQAAKHQSGSSSVHGEVPAAKRKYLENDGRTVPITRTSRRTFVDPGRPNSSESR